MKKLLYTLNQFLFLIIMPALLFAHNRAPIPSVMLHRAKAELVDVNDQNERIEPSNTVDAPKKQEEKSIETLQEEEAPPPSPALFDLHAHQTQKSGDLTSLERAGLIFFNALMFAAGIAIVKTPTGKKVH